MGQVHNRGMAKEKSESAQELLTVSLDNVSESRARYQSMDSESGDSLRYRSSESAHKSLIEEDGRGIDDFIDVHQVRRR